MAVLLPQVDLIVSSPLTRALETMAGFFGTPLAVAPHGGPRAADVLMNATMEIADKRVAHAAIGSAAVPVIACELCREAMLVCLSRSLLGHLLHTRSRGTGRVRAHLLRRRLPAERAVLWKAAHLRDPAAVPRCGLFAH